MPVKQGPPAVNEKVNVSGPGQANLSSNGLTTVRIAEASTVTADQTAPFSDRFSTLAATHPIGRPR